MAASYKLLVKRGLSIVQHLLMRDVVAVLPNSHDSAFEDFIKVYALHPYLMDQFQLLRKQFEVFSISKS